MDVRYFYIHITYKMKSVLLLKSNSWSLEFYVQYKMQKKMLLKSRHSCFHSALFDYSHSQIPGQSESQELHFGQLHVFIL